MSKETVSSASITTIILAEKLSPVVREIAIEKLIANNTMTRKSIRTVTPSTIRVKGPFALNSLIIAMAETGERAMKIVPVIKDKAILPLKSNSKPKKEKPLIINTATLPNTKVVIICPKVIH